MSVTGHQCQASGGDGGLNKGRGESRKIEWDHDPAAETASGSLQGLHLPVDAIAHKLVYRIMLGIVRAA